MSPKTIYKQTKILYYSILAGLVIFLAIGYAFVLKNGAISVLTLNSETTMQSLIIILILVGVPVSYIFHSKKTSHIDPELPLYRKLIHYRRSLFVKLATLEGLSLFCLLAYIMTGTRSYLFIYFILLIVYLMNFPGKNKIKQELKLEDQQTDF